MDGRVARVKDAWVGWVKNEPRVGKKRENSLHGLCSLTQGKGRGSGIDSGRPFLFARVQESNRGMEKKNKKKKGFVSFY